MPMGDLSTAPTFLAMIIKLQLEWYTLAKDIGLKNVASKMIFNVVLMYG